MSENVESAREFVDRLFGSPTLEQDAKLIKARDAAIRQAAMEAALYGPALTGWIQVLGARRNEPGYTDEYCANEAARLAVYTARAVLGWAGKETI